MYQANDDVLSDEDDSYDNLLHLIQHKKGYYSGEVSVIDESDIEETINESSLNNSTNDESRHEISRRESTVLPFKKKAVRILDSEDDEDSDSTPDNISADLSNTTPKIREDNKLKATSSQSLENTESFLKVQKKTGISHDRFEEDRTETQILAESNSKSPIDRKIRRTKKKSNVMASDSEEDEISEESLTQLASDSKTSTDRNSSRKNNRKSNAITSESEEVEKSENTLLLSEQPAERSNQKNISENSPELNKSEDSSFTSKIANARISNQFRFNSEGILNSTTIHSTNQNPSWRLSTNFSQAREIREESSEPSIEILSDHDSDVIEVSSDENYSSPHKTPFKVPKARIAARQQTLHSFIIKKEASTPQPKQPVVMTQQFKPLAEVQLKNPQNVQPTKTKVSREEYEHQWSRVNSLEMDFIKLQNMIENISFEALPDKGQLIKDRLRIAKNRYMEEKQRLEKMNVSETNIGSSPPKGTFDNMAWEDLEAGANAVLPKTFGKKAMSTYNTQKAVTLDRLQQLHSALQTCPKEEDLEEDPKGIKVPLMPHQKRALAWILFREKEKPSGGILADDMGLGKTLTMISIIVKSLELERKDNNSDEENEYIGRNTKFNGGSLIVCPASLINQWSEEIDKRLKRGLVSYNVYHGAKRETKAKKLAEYDVVITTYSIVNNEAEKQGAVFKVKWRRIILDEAHTIRNYKAQTSVACCQLLGKSRWALTGTPMHNKELDMYALLKFLRCSPFDDLQVWKRWVSDKSSGGLERLHTVISSLMLRRTKAELMEKGALNCMPEKKWELVRIELDPNEMRVYHKVLIFSQTLFAQFLHQRAEKNQDYVDQKFTDLPNQAPNQEYIKMRQKLLKLNKVKDVSQHEILVLLLRLRQICCHPSLITAMLDESREDIGEEDEESEHLNLLDQLEKLNIEDADESEDEFKPDASLSDVAQGISQETKVTLKEASKGQLSPSDPVFAQKRASSKIKAMIKVLREKVLSRGDKAIIVSQWSSYLKLVQMHLKDCDVEFEQLDGGVPVNKRMDMVNRLNNPKDKLRVMLLSLTAGGVGLNLVGANHLFLLDLHWNPQLENQAQDRIYRVGQTKPVFIYKFMAADTIEERIKALQDKKLAMAEGLLTGTKQATQSKLSLEDLRMIFGM